MTCIEYKQFKERFKTIGKIGNGNCASVIKIEDNKTKQIYALKCAKFDSADKLAVAFQQIQVIRAVNHPVAIQIEYYFVKSNPGQLFINNSVEFGMIMELGDRNLEQDIFMRKNKQRYYTLDEIQQLAGNLIDFFAAMQIRGYLHRDIKPDNILIMMPTSQSEQSANYNYSRCYKSKYKVCDFGFAVKLHEFSDKNIAGTACYASPKIQSKFKNSQIFVRGNNYKDDVYSLGITLLQVCILNSVEQIPLNKSLQIINKKYGCKFAQIIISMLQVSEEKRPDFIKLDRIFTQYIQIRNIHKNSLNLSIASNNRNKNTNLIPNKNIGFENIDASKAKQKSIDKNYCKVYQQTTSDSDNYINKKQHKLFKENNTNTQNYLTKIYQKQKQQSIKVDSQYAYYQDILKQIYPSQYQTPNRIPQQKNKINHTLQKQKNNNQIYLFQAIEGKDKAKTKRRSKTFANNKQPQLSYNQYLRQQKNKKQQQRECNNIKNVPSSIKQERNKNQISFASSDKNTHTSQQNIKTLYKFQDESDIKFIQIIQLSQQSIQKTKNFSPKIVCMIAKNHLYILCQDLLNPNKLISEIKLQSPLNNPKFMQYNRKLTRLIIANGSNLVITLNMQNILQIISQNLMKGRRRTIIDAKHLDLIQYKNQKINENMQLTAFYVSQDTFDMYKGFSNGELYENGRFLFVNGNKGRVNYIRKYGDLIYVANYQGLIKCYQNGLYDGVGGQRKLMGFYQCKNTLVGLDFVKINGNTLLCAVLAIGIVLYLDKNLHLVDKKNITQGKQCLKAHCFNLQQKQDKKLLTINTEGSIFNQYGQLVVQTKLQRAERLFLVDKGRKIIVVDQNGCIFQVKLCDQQENLKAQQCKRNEKRDRELQKKDQTYKEQQFTKNWVKSKYSLFK